MPGSNFLAALCLLLCAGLGNAGQMSEYPPDIRGLYHFNELGATATDSTLNGNNGSLVNTSLADGRHGKAIYCNGTNAQLLLPDTPSVSPSNGLSVCYWGKLLSTGSGTMYLSNKTPRGFAGGDSWQNLYNPSGQMYFYVQSPTGVTDSIATPAGTAKFGKWAYYCFVWDAKEIGAYVDAVVISSKTPSVANLRDNDYSASLCSGYWSNSYPYYGKGWFDEYAIWGRRLPPGEMSRNYQESLGRHSNAR